MSETNDAVLNQIRAERDFIHDLATPLMIAMGMSDHVLTGLDKNSEDYERLEKAKKSLDKMNNIVKARRLVLIEQSNELNGNS